MAFITGCGAAIVDESLDKELEESDDKEPEDRKGDIYRSIFYIHLYKIFIILLLLLNFFWVNLFFFVPRRPS